MQFEEKTKFEVKKQNLLALNRIFLALASKKDHFPYSDKMCVSFLFFKSLSSRTPF